MNMLNDEIRAIRHTMAHIKRAIPLEQDSGRKLELQRMYKECENELKGRLEKCGDYKG